MENKFRYRFGTFLKDFAVRRLEPLFYNRDLTKMIPLFRQYGWQECKKNSSEIIGSYIQFHKSIVQDYFNYDELDKDENPSKYQRKSVVYMNVPLKKTFEEIDDFYYFAKEEIMNGIVSFCYLENLTLEDVLEELKRN